MKRLAAESMKMNCVFSRYQMLDAFTLLLWRHAEIDACHPFIVMRAILSLSSAPFFIISNHVLQSCDSTMAIKRFGVFRGGNVKVPAIAQTLSHSLMALN